MKALQAQQEQAHSFKQSLTLVDEFAQDGFGRIEAIARLALLAMETPEGHRFMEVYATAFDAILSTACDMKNIISCEAENSGGAYTDPARARRTSAERAFREGQA